jgi:hypothetical protein
MNFGHRTFLLDIDFDYTSATNAAGAVKQSEFKPVAQAFQANIENAVGLLQLPHGLLMWSHMEIKRLLMFTDAYLPLGLKGADYGEAAIKKQVDEEVRRRFDQLQHDGSFELELIPAADSKMAHLLGDPKMQRQIRMILLSLISATWTAFEILAGDAWQLALNSRPDQIAEKVLGQLFPSGTPEGLSAKAIPLWMAAKYGFDLRNHIGDILKPHVDFSDLKQIQKAYAAAFGTNAAFESAVADKNLLTLGATRNLVVHRGGLVDEKYNKITNQSFETSQPLPLDPTFLSGILEAGMTACRTLITCVDGWLCANPPIKSGDTGQTA